MTTNDLTAKINDGLKAKNYATISASPWEKTMQDGKILRRVYLNRSNGKPAGWVNVETCELNQIDGALLKRDLKQVMGV